MQLNRSVTAVITGGASGLGEATARELAAAGVRVAIFDRDKAKGEKVAAEIDGVYCEVDVTDEKSVIAGFEKARAAFLHDFSRGSHRIRRHRAVRHNNVVRAQITRDPLRHLEQRLIVGDKNLDKIA